MILRRYAGFVALLFFINSTIARAQAVPELSAYPLHVQYKRSAKPVLVYLTGDGGWNSFSENLVQELQKNGYSTIALDTRKYFWNQKNPDQFARDIKTILSVYLKAWNKDSFVVLGYSFGADVAAFLPAHLSADFAPKLSSLILLSPGLSTGYVVKLKNLLNFGPTDREKYKVYPELLKSKVPVWCIFGEDEESDAISIIKEYGRVHKLTIPGSHRYDDNIPVVTKAVLRGLQPG
jgi:type IV secretory pathway VirJ component